MACYYVFDVQYPQPLNIPLTDFYSVWKPRSAIYRTTPISACGAGAPHADERSIVYHASLTPYPRQNLVALFGAAKDVCEDGVLSYYW